MIQVLLVDDHAVVREGLRHLLESCGDVKVMGEASDGHEALRQIRQLRPDVTVMDLAMPGLDGIETTKHIENEELKTKIVILTMYTNEEYAVRLLQAGVRGFVGKGASKHEIVEAIRKVAAGGCYLPPTLVEELSKRYVRGETESSPLHDLSDWELQVLKRVAEGYKNREIAQDLYLSVKTVETYRARLLEKLNLQTTADLIRFALRHRVIEDFGDRGAR
jgi:two-component system, NarL family, invasion response regulator UvrY